MATDSTTSPPATPQDDEGPAEVSKPSLRELNKRNWLFAGKRAIKEFSADGCTDLAAALTYYAVLSIFPALLALVSILGLVGEPEQTKQTILDVLSQLGQDGVIETIEGPLDQMVNSSAAGLGLVVGIGGALWSASGYVGAFGRALNTIYEVPEGRGFIKLRPTQVLVTAVLLLLAAAILLSVAVSGELARAIGSTIGLGDAAVTVWNIAKWPAILIAVIFMVGLLYWATPNVRQPRFRWLSPGAAVAILVAVLASVVFGFYVSNFSSYNKTYGSLAGVIVFLLWLWILNNVLLLGAELDSEIERSRQLQAGMAAEDELQLPLRDSTKSDAAEQAEGEMLQEARSLRIEGLRDQGRSTADLADEDVRRP